MRKPLLIIGLVALGFAGCVTVGTVTPLHEAVRDGDMSKAQAEISRGADINAMDEEGRTPLHYACANGDGAMAEWLLEMGADPNLQDARGETPLHYAAANCYASMVQMLLGAGADPALTDNDDRTALAVAREIGCLDAVALLEPATAE